MESANYIPLGDPKMRTSFDESADSEKPLKAIGKTPVRRIGTTPGERKQIAREIRNAAKKEKKKAKSDAKKARKLNDIMTRRATKNPEKYNKNKERNRLRDIEYERHKIRLEAVKQAERLAAIHDPTGKKFNVNPVYVTEDGKVKTVRQHTEEKNEEKEGAKAAAAPPETVNPDRHALIAGTEPPGRKLSNKQKKRLAMYGPKPIPPKPILPEGVTIPEGEENFIAMFDIDDLGVQKRLSEQKRLKSNAARIKRNNQKLASQFKRAMKLKKKQALKMGVEWDLVKAKAEIQGNDLIEDDRVATESDSSDEEEATERPNLDPIAAEAAKSEERRLRREKKRHERLLEGMRIAEEEESERLRKKREAKAKRKEMRKKIAEADAKAGVPIPEPSQKKRRKLKQQEAAARGITVEDLLAERAAKEEAEDSQKKRKRSEEVETTDIVEGEPEKSRKKKSKIVEEPESTTIFEEDKRKKSHKKKSKHTEEMEISTAVEKKAEKSHEKKSKHTEEEETPAAVEEEKPEKSHKKKKSKHHISEADDPTSKEYEKQKKRKASELSVEPGVSSSTELAEADKSSRKKRAKTSETNGAEQWNAEALTGDAARKDKFLRLLGAGKSKSNGEDEVEGKKKKKSKMEDIRKVESDLEMQFETSMKMKNDGGGKKRGLGA